MTPFTHKIMSLWYVFFVPTISVSAENWRPLFNGRDLSGWHERQVSKNKAGRWRVVNGILTAQPGDGWLATNESFGDFILRAEWRISEHGNSGIFFRVPEENFTGSPSESGFEIQILDDHSPKYKGKLKPYQYCGGLYHFVGLNETLFEGPGRWQRYELTVRGDHITLIFNGREALSFHIKGNPSAEKRPRRGQIGLQNHGTQVEFRSIEIRSLD
jgi:hypothetical protein